MAANWQPRSILPSYTTIPSSVTCLSFDPFSELLWSGNALGQVTSFHGTDGTRYTSFMAHRNNNVKGLCLDDRGIVSLGQNGVKGTKRTGVGKWMVHEPRISLEAMCTSPGSSEVVAGGNQLDLLVLNTNSGSLVRKIEVPNPIQFLKPGPRSSVVCGDTSGNVQIRDTRVSKAALQHIQPHSDGLLGIESTGNMLLSWGCTTRFGRTIPEPLVKVYDARMMRPLPPVSFPNGPAFVKIHPKLTTTVFISDLQGQFYVTDLGNSAGAYHQIDTSSYVTSMAVSTAGNHLAFGDSDGSIHIWTDLELGQPENFNAFDGIELDWPSEDLYKPKIDWNEKTPLSIIGLPHYDTPLLSSMPLHLPLPDSSPFFNPPTPIPNSILKDLRRDIFPSHAQNPNDNKGKRNVTPSRNAGRSGRNRLGGRNVDEPKFISEQIRDKIKNNLVNNSNNNDENSNDINYNNNDKSVIDFEEELSDKNSMLKHYRKVEIKYSKFGIEDFDFSFYNKTRYSGLESDITNSYTNSLLQVLNYITPIKNVAKSQTTLPDIKDNCLLTELGFLFTMLDDAKGTNCQSTNFCRALLTFHQAKALGIIELNNKMSPYGNMIQSFNRFLLEQISHESLSFKPLPIIKNNGNYSPISQLLGIESISVSMCTDGCQSKNFRKGLSHVIELMYPRKPLSNETPLPEDFGYILKSSITRDNFTKHVCPVTKQYVPLHSRRFITTFDNGNYPALLSINAGVHSKENLEIWTKPQNKQLSDNNKNDSVNHFLPLKFGIGKIGDDLMICTDDEDINRNRNNLVVYNLKAVVAQIHPDSDSNHLVSIVRISDDDPLHKSQSRWYIFNDFLVKNVNEIEALTFYEWKIPCVIYYEMENINDNVNLSILQQKIDPYILCQDHSISWKRDPLLIKHKVLNEFELPKPGTLVAIDAEFVAMDKEEIEFRSDGTRSVIKPSKLSLARVSVLRGQGELDQIPFIDDYIHTSEPVIDYLTEFSGIKHGDLEPSTSKHTLVPLKAAYRKLRLLVDMGCIFVGHGLSQDFRIINLFVPKNQIIDTVELFQKKDSHRKLSLKFLSWFLLKQDIQLDTHDSIEDAKCALLLYKMYKAFEKDGRLEDVMDDIYSEGRRLNWRPPQSYNHINQNNINNLISNSPRTLFEQAIKFQQPSSTLQNARSPNDISLSPPFVQAPSPSISASTPNVMTNPSNQHLFSPNSIPQPSQLQQFPISPTTLLQQNQSQQNLWH